MTPGGSRRRLTASLTYTFDRPGQILLGCHQPGHYTGGMKATVNVA